MTNELYVQLLEAPLLRSLATARARGAQENRPSRSFTRTKAGLYARAVHPGLLWHSHHEVQLPWREYEVKAGKSQNRVIIPDATVEIPGPFLARDEKGKTIQLKGRRIFLETETGSQTVEPEGDTKPGATVNKLSRYTEYLNDFASRGVGDDRITWYAEAYPDGFLPTVLFMVKDAGRQEVVNRAIEEWQSKHSSPPIHALALTVEGAAEWIRTALPPAWAAPPPARQDGGNPQMSLGVTSGEFRLLTGFCLDAHIIIRASRADARARKIPLPEYPKNVEAVRVLLARLGVGS